MLLRNKSVENCHLSHQLQVSRRAPRSMDLLLNFFFVFVKIGPYGTKNFKWHFLWKYAPDALPKNHAYSWGGSLPKLFKELWNLKFWIFAKYFSFSLTWDNMGVKVQMTSPLKEHTRFAPKNSWILLGRVSTRVNVQWIVKFDILNFWHFLCSFFLMCNMVVNSGGRIIKCAISWKPLVLEGNGLKFGPSGSGVNL